MRLVFQLARKMNRLRRQIPTKSDFARCAKLGEYRRSRYGVPCCHMPLWAYFAINLEFSFEFQ